MSLASSPDCFPRPEDTALKFLFSSADQPAINSFDDFFDRDFYEASGDEGIKEEHGSTDDLFAVNPCSLTNEFDSVHATTSQSERSPPQPWRKGVWCLNQKPGQLVVEKTRKANNAPPPIVSPAHLVANDNFALRSPRSTTQPYETKSFSPDRLQIPHCWTPSGQQSPSREMSLSPSPIYTRSFVDGRNGYVDAWQQDFQNISLQLNDDYLDAFGIPGNQFTEQPGYTPGRSRQAYMANSPTKMEQIRSATMHHLNRPRQEAAHAANQNLASILNANLNATNRNMFSEPPDRNDMSYRFINEDLPPMSDWTSESPNSSHNSHNSQFSNLSGESHNGMYNTLPPQNWWSPPTTHAQTQSSQASREHYPQLVQPKPRRATHHVLSHDDSHDDGLGIKYPSSEEIGVAIPYQPAELRPSSMPQIQTGYQSAKPTHANALSSYPALPPPVRSFPGPDSSPFTTPRRGARNISRSPSPSMSPTHRSSRSMRQRSPSRRDPSQHRRKSIHKSGPVKGSETPRHRSTSRPPRTPKTPKTPGDAFAIDFVNFTPKDASKLLNDVAPSGSSKTRQRREQEARERRKKLSEAALQAVRRAGGDVEALERTILT